MLRALELALRGRGFVEPNPMVGCVIVRNGEIVGEGWHEAFGGPHAEVKALDAAGKTAFDGTMYVTLEPCCHEGKTPPCSQAVIDAGIRRVVVAHADPFPQVAGKGISQLKEAGIAVEVNVLRQEAREINLPYFALVEAKRPWVVAKWAMTLDGKIATTNGDSRWISNEQSRAIVHQIRGRVDGILVGAGTLLADDPQLTARPPGPRTATRIVVGSENSWRRDSRLLQTAEDAPVLFAATTALSEAEKKSLRGAGCDYFQVENSILELIDELGYRRMTNLLVEGGGETIGSLFDLDVIDEVHVFVAPKIAGGSEATAAVAGRGVATIADAFSLHAPEIQLLGEDVYVCGRVRHRDGAWGYKSSRTAGQ